MKKLDKPLYVYLGQQIKEARLRKGYSLQHVADMVGVNKTTIKRYEDAITRVDMDTLNKIADVLDMQVMNGTAEYNGETIERHLGLFPKLNEQWIEQDRDIQKYNAFLVNLSEEMIIKFLSLDINSQKIILLMLNYSDDEANKVLAYVQYNNTDNISIKMVENALKHRTNVNTK